MSFINPTDQSALQAVDSQLQQYIQQAEEGQNVDLSAVEQQLTNLLNNPKIPQMVKQNLQAAINEIKQMKTDKGDISHLYSAKMQLDEILGGAQAGGGASSKEEVDK